MNGSVGGVMLTQSPPTVLDTKKKERQPSPLPSPCAPDKHGAIGAVRKLVFGPREITDVPKSREDKPTN